MSAPLRRATRRPGAGGWAGILLCAWLGAGCVISHKAPPDLLPGDTAAEDSAPLGGEALTQRKHEMRRAYADMVHFHVTLASLQYRRDKNGLVLFSKFLDTYLGTHVEPLLAGEWQSRHPELDSLDANLRFAKAELLIQLRSPRRAQVAIDELERRFSGREDMLIDYPFGEQRALGEGLELLRNQKWRG
jgi:hypothetical protein